ncbi:MAG: hypothetical protein WD069_20930 [Planctomycetales bacterium]
MAPARLRSRLTTLLLWAIVLGGVPHAARAQLTEQKRAEGFVAVADGEATGQELTQQSELWVLEVRFKPMRLIWVESTDPQTGKKRQDMVWYLVYQAVARPQEGRVEDRDVLPVNVEDPPPGVPLFIPEFTLVTTDEDNQQVYHDAIFPEAMAAILRREKKPLKNSVEIVGPIPPVTPRGSAKEYTLDGVAIFRNVDRRTDFFRILMGGFSNAYRMVAGPDGEPIVARKTVLQKYKRPGDEFIQSESEFKLDGDPVWIYVPEPQSPGAIPPGALDEPAAAPHGGQPPTVPPAPAAAPEVPSEPAVP